MKTRLFFLILVSYWGCCSLAYGDTDNLQIATYQAFIQNSSDMWEKITLRVEQETNPNNHKEVIQLIHCYYGWTSTLIAHKKKKQATKNILKVEKIIQKSAKLYPNDSELLNYKGVFLGYKIALNKLQAILIGHQSSAYIEKAYKMSPQHPQIIFDKANSLYYIPKALGGDKEKALFFFKKVVAIYEQEKNTTHNWIYLQALTLTGRCYELTGNREMALKSYKKVMEISPEFTLVKEQLYPQLLNKKTSN